MKLRRFIIQYCGIIRECELIYVQPQLFIIFEPTKQSDKQRFTQKGAS